MKIILSVLFLSLTFNAFGFDAGANYKKVCATCHTIGGGDKIGPDLAGLSKRRTVKWIVKFVNYPEGMINGDADEEGYEKPDATAKKLFALYKPQMMAEQEMTEAQVKATLKYIDGLKKAPKGKILKLNKALKKK
jgi:cytochrome c2